MVRLRAAGTDEVVTAKAKVVLGEVEPTEHLIVLERIKEAEEGIRGEMVA